MKISLPLAGLLLIAVTTTACGGDKDNNPEQDSGSSPASSASSSPNSSPSSSSGETLAADEWAATMCEALFEVDSMTDSTKLVQKAEDLGPPEGVSSEVQRGYEIFLKTLRPPADAAGLKELETLMEEGGSADYLAFNTFVGSGCSASLGDSGTQSLPDDLPESLPALPALSPSS
jgi:hypothetical protein